MTFEFKRGRYALSPAILGIILAAAAVLAYLPIVKAGFIWDDDAFLTANPLIKAAHGWAKFWNPAHTVDYWPVTSDTLWIEWRLWGSQALGYHLTNLALHICCCVLLWRILKRLAIPGAFLAAALFAVHPVNVETVAWITERKNLLAMLFSLLAIRWFLIAEFSDQSAGKHRSYSLSFLAFGLAMLSKGSAAPLPLVFAGLITWRRPLIARDCLRLAPFLAVSLVLTWVNISFQHNGAGPPVRVAGFLERLLGAGAIPWFYLSKALCPFHLSFSYPAWSIRAGKFIWWMPLLATLGVSALLWIFRHGRLKPVAYAWGYYLVMLAPVAGFVDVYFMRYSLVADHYQHLALIGVLALVAAGWAHWNNSMPTGRPQAVADLVVGALAFLTFLQVQTYHDSETLYRSILQENPSSWMAWNNLGTIKLDQGRLPEATEDFHEALILNPAYAEAHINLARVELEQGRPQDALRECETALSQQSDFAREGHLNKGHAWYQLGDTRRAVDEYRAALAVDPGYSEAHYSLGNVFFQEKQFPAAISEYRQALKEAPDDAPVHSNLGAALLVSGDASGAVTEYSKALALDPENHRSKEGLARAKDALLSR